MTPRNQILTGDAARRLRQLAPASVDAVITSPPFFALRDYGVTGQIGLERNVDEWVTAIRSVMAELARVLTPAGSAWVDLGDSYSRHRRYGAPAKSLLLAPERLALALVDDGWIIRNRLVWEKRNPMPHSVADRLNATHDTVLLLVRSRTYYFDLDRIRLPHRSHGTRRPRSRPARRPHWAGPLAGTQDGLSRARTNGVAGHWLGRNPGDVWTLPAAHFRGAHFATFPEALVEPLLVASTPEAICTRCGAPFRRRVEARHLGASGLITSRNRPIGRYPLRWRALRRLGQLEAGCDCGADRRPGLVLDPFMGSGTVAVVAERHRRDWLGIELNPEYVDLAQARIAAARAPTKAAA